MSDDALDNDGYDDELAKIGYKIMSYVNDYIDALDL
jgi:hypothetical protein